MKNQNNKDPDRYAPKGKVWRCRACGKISPNDAYGDKDSSRGWDVSCVLNAELVDADEVKKRSAGV